MKKIPSAVRHAQIRERLAVHPGVSVAELARDFRVSEMTIRRDLAALETKEDIQRTHGGAVLTNAVSGIYLFREALNGLAGLYDWPGYLLAPKTPQKLSAAEIDRYVGTYRIVSGIELPILKAWREGEQLFTEIPGLRVGVRKSWLDEQGRLFNQSSPFETHVTFGPDGRAATLTVLSGGITEILRAERAPDP